LWDETSEKSSVDCDSLQIAAKIGILGVIIAIAWNFIYNFVMMIYVVAPPGDHALIFQLIANLSALSIVNSTFIGVGFVAIFSMKGSKLGIIFPLMTLGYRVWQYLYLRISYELGINSNDIYSALIMILGYAMTIIGGLLLLSIRRKSENTKFVSFFAIFYLMQNVVSNVIWWTIFRGPVPVNSGLDYFISSLLHLTIFVIVSILTIIFFVLESKQGCVGMNEFQETQFPV